MDRAPEMQVFATDLDRDALDAIRDGEGRVIDALDDAATAVEAQRDRDEIAAMRRELSDLLDTAA